MELSGAYLTVTDSEGNVVDSWTSDKDAPHVIKKLHVGETYTLREEFTLLWTEYCLEASAAGKKPYMSTQFNDNYRKWARITKATMRIQHKPGDEMEVDWAGGTIDIYDEITGEISPAYLFVAVLPCSLYVYAELCPNMKSDTFINCHIHAYTYFGGSTRLLIPDNL